jgi:starch phosphorylase
VENSESDSDSEPSGGTLFVIRARNRIGLLGIITRVFSVLGLRVDKATVEFEGDCFIKRFFVTDSHGGKIEDRESLDRIQKALLDAIDDCGGSVSAGPTTTRGVVVRRPGLGLGSGERGARAERMLGLMDGFLKNDPISLQKDILYHVEYTVARSRFSFDDFEAYQVNVFGSSLFFYLILWIIFPGRLVTNFGIKTAKLDPLNFGGKSSSFWFVSNFVVFNCNL